MKLIFLSISLMMLVVAVVFLITQVKNKKRLTDPYVLISILTALIALRMVLRLVMR